ncbi:MULTISPECIES: hypothetical protein [Vibrio]|jgi:hypothetical protein|uniref:Uncharacterized protein n=2 Tax=Vibrio TaxID=662 RepID=A0A2C9PF33_9VIBR|nr:MULTISPECIES: hypothetical protein [Vibrio]ASI91176.1 hypothetical protein BSZ05_15955 [Vibrio mediterranei]AYV20066.1 hypothetical protein ECB94_01585 [Vibrio mediterranei]EDL51630.1 hypothetical protein VSAK1_06310 [Vibrio mediterranei AK1]KFA95462.1 hypothetical protein HW45_24130 [Vibrio sp. ER1A]MCF4173274.1 hypothetical protein [Vibrio sp. McD22-P3]
MKKWLIAAMLVGTSFSSFSADTQCLEKKYDAYIDASIQWYDDLVQLTTQQYPELESVGQWFLDGRKNHFELNREAVHYYLKNEPTKVATERSIESWLQLEQQDVKALAQRNDMLGKAAAKSFADRQAKPHEQNYDLRSAFADLLSHPKKIDTALNKYNSAIQKVEKTECK